MKTILKLALLLIAVTLFPENADAQKAGQPVMLTSCGQSPGPVRLRIFMQRLSLDFEYKEMATAQDLIDAKSAGKPFQSVIIVTGASLKGMGAAGVSVDDELRRTAALIAEAKKQGMKVIGAHIEGMARRSAGASAGDNSDELSIDAVIPNSDMMIIKNEGDSDGRFTTISKGKSIPMFGFELNNDITTVLEQIFINK
jgi:hypothetical protein